MGLSGKGFEVRVEKRRRIERGLRGMLNWVLRRNDIVLIGLGVCDCDR